MCAEYQCRSFRPEDSGDLIELLRLGLGSDIPKTMEFWEWKHGRNPFGPSPILVAEGSGQLVGVRAFMRWNWLSGKTKIDAVRAVDTVTHPEWQGRNIFRTLTSTLSEQMRTEKIQLIYNTPNRYSLPGYLKMGWEKVTRVPIWFRLLKPIRTALRRKTKAGALNRSGWNAIASLLVGTDLEECVRSYNTEIRLHTERSVAYLKWRYSEIPNFTYYALYRRERKDAAMVIFRDKKRWGLTELSISEILATESAEGTYIGRSLLEQILAESDADYSIAIAAPDTPEHNVVRDAGFFPAGNLGPILTVKVLNEDLPLNVYDWSNWRCSIGDLEIF